MPDPDLYVPSSHYKQACERRATWAAAYVLSEPAPHSSIRHVALILWLQCWKLFCAKLLGGGLSAGGSPKQGIELVFPEVLQQGASADVVCFDNTGTLTDSLVSPHVMSCVS